MKKLKLLILCLLSIFCLNSCLTTAFVIASMQGDGLLPYPEPESPYYYGDNKKLNTLLLTENKKNIKKFFIFIISLLIFAPNRLQKLQYNTILLNQYSIT